MTDTPMTNGEGTGRAVKRVEFGKFLKNVLLEDYQVGNIVKECLSEAYQKKFNKYLDYDEFVGIREHLEKCGYEVNQRLRDNIELNFAALYPEDETGAQT